MAGEKSWASKVAFQYPEGFWPDSDEAIKKSCTTRCKEDRFSTPKGFGPIVTFEVFKLLTESEIETFQYPEGFWPDSDMIFAVALFWTRINTVCFSTPKGFGPIVTHIRMERWPPLRQQDCVVSVPRRVLAR